MARAFLSTLILLASLAGGNAHAEGADPAWAELNDDQRKVLTPLAGEWDTMRPWQRERMLDIARDYPKMNP